MTQEKLDVCDDPD